MIKKQWEEQREKLAEDYKKKSREVGNCGVISMRLILFVCLYCSQRRRVFPRSHQRQLLLLVLLQALDLLLLLLVLVIVVALGSREAHQEGRVEAA